MPHFRAASACVGSLRRAAITASCFLLSFAPWPFICTCLHRSAALPLGLPAQLPGVLFHCTLVRGQRYRGGPDLVDFLDGIAEPPAQHLQRLLEHVLRR